MRKDTYIQEAYDALIRELKGEIERQCRQNDADMDANTWREKVLLDFIYDKMGKAHLLAAAARVDAHEKERRKDPSYDYGMVEMINDEYPDTKKGSAA